MTPSEHLYNSAAFLFVLGQIGSAQFVMFVNVTPKASNIGPVVAPDTTVAHPENSRLPVM